MFKLFNVNAGRADIILPIINQQTVRWATKPRWAKNRPAKTKKFLIFQKYHLPQEEADELQRLYYSWRTGVNSLRKYFKLRYANMATSEDVLAQLAKEEEEEWQKCMERNDQWNEDVRVLREARMKQFNEELKEEAIKKVLTEEADEMQRIEEINDIVRKEKLLSKTYITPENIDEAIEKALQVEADFNYAIDLNDNVYLGARGKEPVKLQEGEKVLLPRFSEIKDEIEEQKQLQA